jgi:hypothetical protein
MSAQPTTPSPDELIQKAITARNTQDARDRKYTYREDHTDTQLDKDGKPSGSPETRTYDHIMLEGENYSKLILINGNALDAKTQKKVDEDLEKARKERRGRGLLTLHRSVSLGGLEFLPRLFDNRITGEETVLGRKTWRMESEPKAGYKPANKEEEEALASRRVNWFDEEDGYGIKENSLFIRATNSFQRGRTIDLEYLKVGDDWLPGNAIMRADMKMMPGIHGRAESQQRYSEHKRFTVDSNMTTQ